MFLTHSFVILRFLLRLVSPLYPLLVCVAFPSLSILIFKPIYHGNAFFDHQILKPAEKKQKYNYGGMQAGRPVTPPRAKKAAGGR